MLEDVIKVAIPLLKAMSKIGWTINGNSLGKRNQKNR